jgi:quercetin dioxygenase-like cupin family protein
MKHDLSKIEEKEILPGLFVKFVHSENMSFAYWRIEKGADLPAHSHHHEQVVNVIEGEFELMVDGKPTILQADMVYIIPPHASHGGRAITDCRIIDVFYPVRDDYKTN